MEKSKTIQSRNAFMLSLLMLLAMPGCATPQTGADSATVSHASAIDGLGWLAGGWVQRDGAGRIVAEESWITPRGGSMLGVNRIIRDGATVFYEFLRIEAGRDGVTYHAAPRGRHPATPFRLVEQRAEFIAFENPDHDYPQRIEYERQGDTLTSRIADLARSEVRTDVWTRLAP